ncbi:PIG-L deacetylase family protein [Asanoa iriomotensis]|uniref:GlcNAc-PI de-N-acetylase n=1 Tax=Asanoa iriomotensis TaxID=234613 RepID=A0ABQ4BZ94_9ACTN|nr:PIG-L family deacetylase [Asanoa iriomotensis]GIF55858.1 GlcNAc-PI de-N-acetylase [Asanoa iriomotensis]
MTRPGGFTVVAFHAHPDDEALLTGGTLARLAADGHRVVLVVATLGEAGLSAGPTGDALAARRRDELRTAASALGCARVVELGYLDSGLRADYRPPDGAHRFVDVPVATAAARLAEILLAERAEVLTTYDPRGGYGHPDHVQVHRVGAAAARLAGTPIVLEATVDRRPLRPILAVLRLTGSLLPRLPLGGASTVFTDHAVITHAIDVRPFLRQKRAALKAHASQTEGGRGPRTLAILSRLPLPVLAAVAGREWFVETGRAPGQPFADDVFLSLRERPARC